MSRLAEYAKVVVVSSPDRYILYKRARMIKSPPANLFHVREWSIDEAKEMIMDYNMYPVVAGRLCNAPHLCVGNKFTPAKDSHVTWLMANVNLPRIADQLKSKPGLTVFLFLYVHVNSKLLLQTITHYTSQEIQVILISIGDLDPVDMTTGLHTVQYHHFSDVRQTALAGLMNRTLSTADHTDWFMIADANEIILARDRQILDLTLPQCLAICKDYNGVTITTVFAQSPDGNPWDDYPFKINLPNGWDAVKMTPLFNPAVFEVRIWRNQIKSAVVFNVSPLAGIFRITGVRFAGLQTYPFSLTSVRYHPDFDGESSEVITPYLEQMYGVHLAIGYMPVNRSEIIEPRFLY